jgi:hypothetical protein
VSVEDDDVADGDVDVIVPRGCPEVDATGACAELAVFNQKIVQRAVALPARRPSDDDAH